MSPLTAKIWTALEPTLGSAKWIPMRSLEEAVGAPTRGLQAQAGKPGPLDLAMMELFIERRVVLVTQAGKGGGVKLTRDAIEIMRAQDKLRAHAKNELAKVNRVQRILRRLQVREGGTQERDGQIRLAM